MKIERNSITYLMVSIVIYAVVAMILWPLLDLIICKIFTKSAFEYSVVEHVVSPIIFGTILGIIEWIINKVRSRKSK